MPQQKALLEQQFNESVEAETEKRVAPYIAKVDRLRKKLNDAEEEAHQESAKYNALNSRYKTDIANYQEIISQKNQEIDKKDSIISDLEERLHFYLNHLSELLRKAVLAVVNYVHARHPSFSYRQEGEVKRYLNSQTDKKQGAQTILAYSLPFLNADDCKKVQHQLDCVVEDMTEEQQQSRSRGFHL